MKAKTGKASVRLTHHVVQFIQNLGLFQSALLGGNITPAAGSAHWYGRGASSLCIAHSTPAAPA